MFCGCGVPPAEAELLQFTVVSSWFLGRRMDWGNLWKGVPAASDPHNMGLNSRSVDQKGGRFDVIDWVNSEAGEPWEKFRKKRKIGP